MKFFIARLRNEDNRQFWGHCFFRNCLFSPHNDVFTKRTVTTIITFANEKTKA